MGRRLLAALVVTLLLGTAFSLHASQAASAEVGTKRAAIELDPACTAPIPVGIRASPMTLTVHGHDFTPGNHIQLYYPYGTYQSTLVTPDPVAIDQYGSFTASFTTVAPISGGVYEVFATEFENGDTNAVAYLQVPCYPTVSVTPTCGPNAETSNSPTSVSVTGRNFSPSDAIAFSLAEDSQITALGTANAGKDGSVSFGPIPIGPLPQGTYSIRAQGRDMDSPTYTSFEAPCPNLSITLQPTCSDPVQPPGIFSIGVTGSGWDANSQVQVTWAPWNPPDWSGSNEEWQGVSTDGTGAFSTSITPYGRPDGKYTVLVEQFGETEPERVMTATYLVPCTPARITVAPPGCAWPALQGDPPSTYSIDVSGTGFIPQTQVQIVFDPDGKAAKWVPVAPEPSSADANGNFLTTIHPAARPAGVYRIQALQVNSDGVTERSAYSADFPVPCKNPVPRIAIAAPACGQPPPGDPYSIDVSGRGLLPGGVDIIFDAGGQEETFHTTATASKPTSLATFAKVSINPARRPAGTYKVVVRQADISGRVLVQAPSAGGSPVLFTVPCVNPTIVINPTGGQTGYVCFVDGTNFNAGTTVTLTWNYGIGAAAPTRVQVQPDGSFHVGILIYPHDLTGQRTLTAGLDSDPNAYPGVTANYLVMDGSGQVPATSSVDAFAGRSLPLIVFRR